MPTTATVKVFLCLLFLCLGGCKVVISPGPGGAVVSTSGDYSCAPGERCTIDVTTTEFDEVFQAIPLPGYEFVRWRKVKNSFCGNRSDDCHLFTTAFGDSAQLLGFLADDEKFFFLEAEFRPVDAGNQDYLFFDVDESGQANGVVGLDGSWLSVQPTEEGDVGVLLTLPEGQELYLVLGADGLPRELFFDGVVMRFRSFTDTDVIVEVIDAAGTGAVAGIAYDGELAQLVQALIDSATAASAPYRGIPARASHSIAPAESFISSEISKLLTDGVKSIELAQKIIDSESFRPLFTNASKSAVKTVAKAIASNIDAQGDQRNSVDLTVQVLAGAGACYLSIAGGGLIKIATGLPGCEEFVKGTFAAVNSWAVNVVANRYKNTLDALAAQAPLYGDEFASQSGKRLVSTKSVLGDYSQIVTFPGLEDGDFVAAETALSVRVNVVDQVTEAPIGRSRTIDVEQVTLAKGDRKLATFNLNDVPTKFKATADGTLVTDVLGAPGGVRTEGTLVFQLNKLAEGEHRLKGIAGTLGIFDTSTVTVTATPYTPPFGVQLLPDPLRFAPGEVSVTAQLVDAKGVEIPDADYQWTSAGSVLANGATLNRPDLMDAGRFRARVTATKYDREFSENAVFTVEERTLTGTWTVTQTEDETGCEGGIYVDTFQVRITQNGSQVTLAVLNYTATLQGNVIRWSLERPEPPGRLSSSGQLTVSADYNSLSGSERWTYTEPGYTCSGTVTYSASRVSN